MNILFLTSRLPYPPNRGDRVRTLNFARVLAEEHTLHLLSFIESSEELRYLRELEPYFDRIDTVLLSTWRPYFNMALSLLSKTPLRMAYYHSKEMQTKLDHILASTPMDLAYVLPARVASFLSHRKCLFRILDVCDARSVFMRRLIPFAKPYLKPVLYREWLTTRWYYASMIRQFDECWFASAADMEALQSPPNSVIVPQAVDIDYFKPQTPGGEGDILLFVGYMGVESVDAITYFYNQIFPLVRESIPSVIFYIVGAPPPRQVLEMARDKRVVVTGFVEDLRPYYDRAAVLVAPMRFVTGVQTKILEAMAMETPVVTTSMASEGIQATPGRHIFVADDTRAFSERLVQLLRDPELRRRVGSEARVFVAERFRWEIAAERVRQLEGVIQGLGTS